MSSRYPQDPIDEAAPAPERRDMSTKQPVSLLSLPGELRNHIYDYVLNWESLEIIAERSAMLKEGLDGFLGDRQEEPESFKDWCTLHQALLPNSQFSKIHFSKHTEVEDISTFRPRPRTPGLLLANKQIHNEAIDILIRKPLIFTEPVPYGEMNRVNRYGDLSAIISNELLQKVERIEIHIKKEGVAPCVYDIFPARRSGLHRRLEYANTMWHAFFRRLLTSLGPDTCKYSSKVLGIQFGNSKVFDIKIEGLPKVSSINH